MDADGDYWCDICDWIIEHDCIDEDGDWHCDLCGSITEHDCMDKDGDYWCDICDWIILHICEDQDSNSRCDLCGFLMEPIEQYTFNLTLKSFLDEDSEMELLLGMDFLKFPLDFVFEGNLYQEALELPAGTYTLTLSKKNHVTRSCTLVLGPDTEDLTLTICPIGDVSGDGKVNVADTSKIYAHARGSALLSDEYARACADINGDGKINVADVSKAYAHARNSASLWD
jgi:hypothetical protein